jgi:hypothetical protein
MQSAAGENASFNCCPANSTLSDEWSESRAKSGKVRAETWLQAIRLCPDNCAILAGVAITWTFCFGRRVDSVFDVSVKAMSDVMIPDGGADQGTTEDSLRRMTMDER